MEMEKYLEPTFFINSDNSDVIDFSDRVLNGERDDVEKSVALYYAVRDEILYDPYAVSFEKEVFRASYTIKAGRGYCVAKSVLLTALLRHNRIPARLGFADVTNHLNTESLRKKMGTDIFYFHGYTDIYLNGTWVKATPAFNITLCERFGVKPLEFDGINDSIFHPLDQNGRKHMEYINDRGTYEDLPFDEIHEVFEKEYPNLYEDNFTGDFEKEVNVDNKTS